MKKLLFCMFLVLGISVWAKPITTDGKPHFDKISNRIINYTDTDSYFKIVKKGNDYILYKVNKSGKKVYSKEKLKVYKEIYLMDRKGILYAYDTARRKLAFLELVDNEMSGILFLEDQTLEDTDYLYQ